MPKSVAPSVRKMSTMLLSAIWPGLASLTSTVRLVEAACAIGCLRRPHSSARLLLKVQTVRTHCLYVTFCAQFAARISKSCCTRMMREGFLTFKLGLIYAVFCRSLVAAKGVGRKLKVSKCLGINSPCEAVAHVLVLDLHELSEDTFVTSLLQPAHLMVPSNDIVCEVSCAMSGEKAGKMFFGFEKSTLALIAEIQEGKHSALQVFLPKKTPSATPHASGKSDPAPAAVEDHVGFTPLDFPKGQVGQRNVRTFVTKLLEVYKSKGVNLVTNVITAGTHWLRELRFSLRPWLRQGIRARTRMFIHRACVANSLSVSAGTPEFLFFNMFQSFISAVL